MSAFARSVDASDKHDIFISYSRKDKEFVDKLHDALRSEGQNPWIDWVNIPKGVDWWQCIESGIESAYTFVFVVSPDSIISEVCKNELEYAASLNKRLLPVIWRQVADYREIPLELRKINWNDISFEDDFSSAFKQLIEAVNADLDHIRFHTYLLERSLGWERRKRRPDMLLRGSELAEASNWLISGAAKKPQPSQLQVDYINASKKAEAVEKRKRRFSQSFIAGGIGLFIIYGLLAANLRSAESAILALSPPEPKQGLDKLLDALRAGSILHQDLIGWYFSTFEPGVQAQTVITLYASIANLNEHNRLEGHQGIVYTAIFSPNGQLIASAGEDQSVKLWHADGRLIKDFTGHQASITSLDFSPDGQVLASASDDGTVKLWDVAEHYTAVIYWKTLFDHKGPVYKVRFSPDGKLIATASTDGTVKIWSRKGKLLHSLSHRDNSVYNVTFSPDGKTLATASADGVRLWNRTQNGDFVNPRLIYSKPTVWISFSPDGKQIATAGFENSLQLWNRDGEAVATLEGHQARVRRVEFSPNGKLLASVSDDNTVRLWTSTGHPLEWQGEPVVLRGNLASVTRTKFIDDQRLITAGQDGPIKLWKIDKDEAVLLNSFEGHRTSVSDIAISPDKAHNTIVCSGADGTVRVWNLEKSTIQPLHHGDKVFDVVFSPDGKFVASAGFQTINLWLPNGTPISTPKDTLDVAHETEVRSISLSHNGQLLASGGADGQVKLWTLGWNEDRTKLEQATSKSLVQQKPGLQFPVSSVSFRRDGKILASGGDDQMVRLWDRDGRPIHAPLAGHRASITSVNFGPVESHLLISSGRRESKNAPGEIIVWNTNGKLIQRLTNYANHPLGDILSVSFSPDGRFVAAADSADNTVKLWKLNNNKLLPYTSLVGHSAPVRKISYSADGKLLASTSQDGTVRLWTAEGILMTTFRRHQLAVNSVAFSPDDKTLASASNDNLVLLWQLPSGFDKDALDKLLDEGCNATKDYLQSNQNPDPQISKNREEVKQFCDKLR